MPDPERYDVLLSCSTPDRGVARALAAELRGKGLEVFFDRDSLAAGESWRAALSEATDQVAVAVVLVGDASSTSDQLQAEASAAAYSATAGRSLLIPVLLGGVDHEDVPEPLRRFAPLRIENPTEMTSVADAIARAAAEVQRPPPIEPARLSIPDLPDGYVENGSGVEVREAIESAVRDQSGPVQVTGVAGSGKTAAMLAACHGLIDGYDIARWISGTTERAVVGGLAELAPSLGLASSGSNERDLARAVVDDLRRTDLHWLLVIDDADDGGAWLASWIPPTTPTGTAVVASRTGLRLPGSTIRLRSLGERTALATLEQLLGEPFSDDARNAAGQLMSAFGGVTPLELVAVAALLRSEPGPIEDRIRRTTAELQTGPLEPAMQTIGRAVENVFTSLIGRTPVTERIAWVLTAAGERPVPAVLFHLCSDDPFLASDASQVAEALDELEASGLIQTELGAVTAHPLASAVATAGDASEPLMFLARAAARWRSAERRDARERASMGDLAWHLITRADDGGSSHAFAAGAQFGLEVALTIQDAGELDDAAELLLAVHQRCEAVLGPDDPLTLSISGHVAGALQAVGRLEEAATLLEGALTRSEHALGPEHPTTLTSRANLAAILRQAGRLEEAIDLLRRTLEDSERVLGAEHPSTLSIRAGLAVALQEVGRHDSAVSLLEETLAASEHTLGPEHVSTLNTSASLASALYSAGQPERAATLMERAAAVSERALGPEDPSTLNLRANLAAVLPAVGRDEEAAAILAETHRTSERVLGADHWLTQEIARNAEYLERLHGGDD
jgi:tetratricopeptide (TPR) repeat protein